MTRKPIKHYCADLTDFVLKNIFFQIRAYFDLKFDKQYGIATAGTIELQQLNIPSENKGNGHRYRGVSPKAFGYVLSKLELDFTDYSFIDFGSGKGRALLLASSFPFKAIIGIEFSPKLHEIAENNIAIFAKQTMQCTKISSLCMDALDYPIPEGDLLLFFYNPFNSVLTEKIVANIVNASANATRRVVVVFYTNNQKQIEQQGVEAFDKTSYFQVRKAIAPPFDLSRMQKHMFFIYSNKQI